MPSAPKRQWNGYGLSFFRCRCGAARRADRFLVDADHLRLVYGPPCKRCGDTGPIPHWPADPWLYIAEEGRVLHP